jgi:hypothetical protein
MSTDLTTNDVLVPSHVDLRALRRVWGRWRHVVEHFSRGKTGKPMSSDSYEQMHRQLLAMAREYADQVNEQLRPAFRQLEKIVAPWMTLESLAAANRTLLTRALSAAYRVELSIFGRVAAFSGMKIVAWMLSAALFGGVSVWLLTAFHAPATNGSFKDILLIELKRGMWRLVSYSDGYQLIIAGLIALLVAAWMVSSTQRY